MAGWVEAMEVSMTENHVERCHCWECGGYGKKEYEQAVPDPIRGGDLVGS